MEPDFQKYFNEPLTSIKPINNFGNNLLFEIAIGNKKYLLKKYSPVQRDGWNRGKTEFFSLKFLWNRKFREIPMPIKFFEKENIGIFSFEEGKIIEPKEVAEKDIIAAADFLLKIHNLENYLKTDFPFERTKCLCFSDYHLLIEERYRYLIEDFNAGESERVFLVSTVRPRMNAINENLRRRINEKDMKTELPIEKQVITPGDFGFHNILQNKEKYIFLDFEFCGRDDPCKQILDFLHHDRSKDIKRELKDIFLNYYLHKSKYPNFLKERIKILDEIIGMNWVLIYLNPLTLNYQKHLNFSTSGKANIKQIIEERIIKAKNKLVNLSYFNKI